MNTSRIIAIAVVALAVVVFGSVKYAQAFGTDKLALEMARNAPAVINPLTRIDQWRASCTVDGGASADLYDDADGGIHCAGRGPDDSCPAGGGYQSVHVTNDNAVCAHVGGPGVTALEGFEIGTGAGCIDGPSVSLDTQAPIRCTSAGAAVLVRVKAGK